ncbi:MAG: Transposase [Acidobacteriota bacterium]|nr:Transposase [Acidobacteriota bacterium]
MNLKTKDLNLIMIYLNGWEEESRKDPGGKVFRAWKNYPFDVLNELERENMIRQYPKSLIVTKEGKTKAEGLMHQYLKV